MTYSQDVTTIDATQQTQQYWNYNLFVIALPLKELLPYTFHMPCMYSIFERLLCLLLSVDSVYSTRVKLDSPIVSKQIFFCFLTISPRNGLILIFALKQ